MKFTKVEVLLKAYASGVQVPTTAVAACGVGGHCAEAFPAVLATGRVWVLMEHERRDQVRMLLGDLERAAKGSNSGAPEIPSVHLREIRLSPYGGAKDPKAEWAIPRYPTNASSMWVGASWVAEVLARVKALKEDAIHNGLCGRDMAVLAAVMQALTPVEVAEVEKAVKAQQELRYFGKEESHG